MLVNMNRRALTYQCRALTYQHESSCIVHRTLTYLIMRVQVGHNMWCEIHAGQFVPSSRSSISGAGPARELELTFASICAKRRVSINVATNPKTQLRQYVR